jgi:hypothetical protein
MNNIFMGRYSAHGLIYDYSGVWQRRSGGIEWKAVVRNADIVCRPKGVLLEDVAEGEVVPAIAALVEEEIEQARLNPPAIKREA